MTAYYSPHTGEVIITTTPAAWMSKTSVNPPEYDKTKSSAFFRNGEWRVIDAVDYEHKTTACANRRTCIKTFPLLAGMNIGKKNYEDESYQSDIARLNFVILGFYRGWSVNGNYKQKDALSGIKSKNKKIQIGQYTILNEFVDVSGPSATSDILSSLYANGWWLKNAQGDRVQWTDVYNAWETDFTRFANPSNTGDRFPQWLAKRNFSVYFEGEETLNWLYCDNVMYKPRVVADWNKDGINDDNQSEDALRAWRTGYSDYWDEIRALMPDIKIMGNADSDLSSPEFSGKLDGAFLEALMGESWSIESRYGWTQMMKRYIDIENNLRGVKSVVFNVCGELSDYRFFRYSYASCLLRDGFFSFTDRKAGYSSVPWFDEFNINLGYALAPQQAEHWCKGVWRRDFSNGAVLVNPTEAEVSVTVDGSLSRFYGTQDGKVNCGGVIETITIPPKDGIVLVKQ